MLIKVQLARQFLSPPSVGKWTMYTAAVFEGPTAALPAGVMDNMVRLFLGQPGAGVPPSPNLIVFSLGGTDRAVGSAVVNTWTWGPGWDFANSFTTSIPNIVGTGTTLPLQIGIPLGYRTAPQGRPEKGRSRFFLGPVAPLAGMLAGSDVGGLRLSPTAVDKLVANAMSAHNQLLVAGYRLMVRTGKTNSATFAPAVKFSVGDRFSTMRSRNTWELYRKEAIIP